jgi:hypothetical protein
MIKEFVNEGSKEQNISVELKGFRKEYKIENSASHVTSMVTDSSGPVSPGVLSNGAKVPSNILKVKELARV